MEVVLQQAAGARPFAWRDVRAEAEAELARARAEAGRILSAARAEAERIRAVGTEAREKALSEGREAGKAEVLAQVRVRVEAELPVIRGAFEAVAAALQGVPALAAERAESEAVKLAVEVASIVVKREVRLDPALVGGNLRAAVEALAVPGRITVRLNPEDKAVVEPGLPEILRGLSVLGRLDLEADPSVARGGCSASASGASADATVEGQLAEIRKALLGEGA